MALLAWGCSGGGGTTGTGGAGPSGGAGTSGGGAGTSGGGVTPNAIPGPDSNAVATSGPTVKAIPPLAVNVGNLTGVTPRGLATDGLGNVYVVSFPPVSPPTLVKLDGSLHASWAVTPEGFGITPKGNDGTWYGLAADGAGNAYIAGYEVGKAGAIVKYAPDATRAWLRAIGKQMFAVAVGPDGSVYATGYDEGLLPDQPSNATGHGFEAHFGADGTLLRVAQSQKLGLWAGQVLVDTAGNSVILNLGQIVKWDPSFSELWVTPSPDPVVISLAVSPSGAAIYDTEGGLKGLLEQRSAATGAVGWQKSFAVQTAAAAEKEKGTWTGTFTGRSTPARVMLATNDALYIAGSYSNWYMDGANPPPLRIPCYVARLDTTGKQLWFREFEEQATNPSERDFTPVALALNGTKLVVAGGHVVFQLNTADGTEPAP